MPASWHRKHPNLALHTLSTYTVHAETLGACACTLTHEIIQTHIQVHVPHALAVHTLLRTGPHTVGILRSSYGILVMAYLLRHISYGILVMAY